MLSIVLVFFFSSRRRHTRCLSDWSSDVCSSDLQGTTVKRNVDRDNQSLRGFLRLAETEYPEELLRVREPIDLRFDATALVFELDHAGKSPVVMFENVRGSAMQLVTNVAGNRKLLAACLGVEPGNLPTAFRERCQKYIPCELVDRGGWEDVVLEGDDVDLTKLPVPLQFTVDAAPYITAGQIVARDPVTGVDTTDRKSTRLNSSHLG